MQEINGTFIVQVPRAAFEGAFAVTILIEAEPGDVRIEREVEFLGPDPALLRRQTP